jgi:hypothetical protein
MHEVQVRRRCDVRKVLRACVRRTFEDDMRREDGCFEVRIAFKGVQKDPMKDQKDPAEGR